MYEESHEYGTVQLRDNVRMYLKYVREASKTHAGCV